MNMVRDAQKTARSNKQSKTFLVPEHLTTLQETQSCNQYALIVMTTAFHISYCMYKDDYAVRL